MWTEIELGGKLANICLMKMITIFNEMYKKAWQISYGLASLV